MILAIRDVRHNLLRFCLTAFGIGLLAAGTLTINGIYNGIVEDALNLVQRIETDLWVVQESTTGPFAEASSLGPTTLETVRAIEGVARARRFDLFQSELEDGTDVTLMPLDYPEDNGRDLPLVQGRPLAALRGEAVADIETGLGLGDRVWLGEEQLTIVGLVVGLTETNGEPVLGLSGQDFEAVRRRARQVDTRPEGYTDPERAWPVPGGLSAILVEARPGVTPQHLADRIGQIADVEVLTSGQQRDLIVNGRLARMRLQILIFSTLLTAITAVVVTLTIYTLTIEKQHTIALLKLVGASAGMVGNLILTQSLLLAALGYAIGIGLEAAIAPLFPRRVLVQPSDFVILATAVIATCLAGSVLGIARAIRVRAQEILS